MTRIPDFHAEMDRLQNHIPSLVGHNLNRLREKRAIWVRVFTGVALIVAWGFVPFPLVGIWMLPVGLALLLMTFQPCVRQSLVFFISLIARLRKGNVRIACHPKRDVAFGLAPRRGCQSDFRRQSVCSGRGPDVLSYILEWPRSPV